MATSQGGSGSEHAFGRLLQQHRVAAGLSQEALAERAGLSDRAISALERGVNRTPRLETVTRLAAALALNPTQRTSLLAAARPGQLPPSPAPTESLPANPALGAPLPVAPVSHTSLPPSGPSGPAAQGLAPLPLPPTPLLGREHEEAALTHLLQQPRMRLLTLTGPAGVGKTRLALQVAAALQAQGHFADGVAVVDLAPLSDPTLLAATIAQVLGLMEVGSPPLQESLVEYLRGRHLLLLLDNFEHLLAAAPLVADLLATCARLVVLVTSRAALRLRGEQQYTLAPLTLPDLTQGDEPELVGQAAAVQLFVQRALAVRPDFALTAQNALAVAQICARLDGLPLAIELAAARSTLLPPGALLARLEYRLAVLVGGARDLPPRQQTLRATLDWSYSLLTAAEQTLFRRLAVFVGGHTLAASEAVCAPDRMLSMLDGVASLVEKSLLRAQEGVAGEPRFFMLETIHEYARAQLEASGEAEEVRRRHAEYFVTLAEAAAPALAGPGPHQAVWLAQLEAEHDNLRTMLNWSRERAAQDLGVRLGAALWRFWAMRGHLSEGRTWLDAVLRGSGEAPAPTRAMALHGAGWLAWRQGDYARATALQEESLALRRELDDKGAIAESLGNLGLMAAEQGDYRRAAALYEEALAPLRELDDKEAIAYALRNLGSVACEQGDYARATALQEESVALLRESGSSWAMAHALHSLGMVAERQGAYAQAATWYEQALVLRRKLGDVYGIAYSLDSLGLMAAEQGDYRRAAALHEEALALHRGLSDTYGIANSLNTLGLSVSKQGDYARAMALYAEALALLRELGDKHGIANTLGSLGLVALEQGSYGRAMAVYKESLTLGRTMGQQALVASGLEGLAAVADAQGQSERAARLLGAAEATRHRIGAPRPPREWPRYERLVSAVRSNLDAEACAAAWAEGQAQPLEQAIAEALG